MLLALIGGGVLVAGIVLVALIARSRNVEVVTMQPPTVTDDSPEALMRAGQKIAAIKRYRELHGVGLKEAKDAVEVLEARLPPQPSMDEISAAIHRGSLLDAVRLYRERTGVGLKEAKDAVDAMVAGQPYDLPAKTLLREVADSDIEATIRRGAIIDAIKLYREQNPGVGLKEAKDAVEAWRARLRAS